MRMAFRTLKKKVKLFLQKIGLKPPSRQSPIRNNDNSAAQLSTPPHNGSSGEQPQLSSIPHDIDTTVEPRPLSLLTNDNCAGQLSLPSIAISPDSIVSTAHIRPPSQLSIHGGNTGTEQLRPQNDILLDANNSGTQQLQVPGLPENDIGQMPHVLAQNPAFYNVQSHGGNFAQVQQVSAHSAFFSEVHGNQNQYQSINNHYWQAGPLKQLADHAMLGATFDSSARDSPPHCHPGTRLDILQSIQQKIHDLDQKAKIAWLKGGAGVGKSAIMQTVAEAEAENYTLGASLFFSRLNNRNDPQKVFTTIAYQLAVKVPSYQHYLTQRITADPSFMSKTMESQFQDLIVTPFAEQNFLAGHHDRVIVIDGLDECESSRGQCRIIELIHDFVSKNPTVPLLWIIASRPEEHILDAFSETKTCLHDLFWEKEVPVDSNQSVRDVECYLDDEFTQISKRYRRLMPADAKWPSEKHFLAILRAASGLFIFASTVIRFIDNDENPVYRLDVVVSAIEKHLMGQDLRTNPLEALDKLYERILSEISSDTLSTAKLVLGYIIINPYIGHSHLGLFWICNIMGITQDAMYAALRKLRSVLTIPEPEDAYVDKVRILHASFSDYLRDKKRSQTYFVSLDEIATHLWNRFMVIDQQWQRNRSYDDVEFSWSPDSIMKVMRNKEDITTMKWKLVDHAGYYWQYLLKQHFESPDTAFHLLISLEDLIAQLKQCDYSHIWAISYSTDEADRVIRCLEKHVPADLLQDMIQDVPFVSLEKNRLLKSLYERRWSSDSVRCDVFVKLDGKTEQDFENDFNKFEQFVRKKFWIAREILDLMERVESARFQGKVLGSRPSKCRVVLRDMDSGKPLYCFPYNA